MYTTQELLDVCNANFTYEAGQLISKRRGRPVGSKMRHGYLNIPLKVAGVVRNFTVHRLIFLMHHGYLPQTVDHINGIRSDNRIENLRAASQSENSCNRPVTTRSKTGVKGVYVSPKPHKRFVVHIQINGRAKHIGYFDDINEAESAYRAAADQYYGEFAVHNRPAD